MEARATVSCLAIIISTVVSGASESWKSAVAAIAKKPSFWLPRIELYPFSTSLAKLGGGGVAGHTPSDRGPAEQSNANLKNTI